MGFGESGGIKEVFSVDEMPTNSEPGEPNARHDLMQSGGKGPNGQKQSRWTNANGQPLQDKDYNHGGKHVFPHYHNWDGGVRGAGYWVDASGVTHSADLS